MKLNQLRKAEAKAHQDLQAAERKAGELQTKAKAAKARAEQARLKYRHFRKAAKQAKKLVLAALDEGRDQLRVWEKAQKRLAKAMKKLAKTDTKKQSQASAAPRKTGLPGSAVKKQTAAPRAPEKRALASPAAQMATAPRPATPPSPAV